MSTETTNQELIQQARVEGVPAENPSKLIIDKFKNLFFKLFFGKPEQDLIDVPSKKDEELVPKGSEDRIYFNDSEETRAPQETEMNSLLATLFRKDIQHMIDAYLETKDNINMGLLFRALMQVNPDHPLGMPILVTRPIERPNKAERDYDNGSDSSIYHWDIWLDWELLTKTDPNNERTLIVKTINEKLGGYNELSHVYLRVKRDKKGKPIITFESGWGYFQFEVAKRLRPEQPNPELTTEETMELIKQLARYGIDTVSYENEVISVEEVVLTEMMRPIILKNAEKLRAVVTDSAVSKYISLAFRFRTKPDVNTSSPLYYRLLEFEEIIKNIDEGSKK